MKSLNLVNSILIGKPIAPENLEIKYIDDDSLTLFWKNHSKSMNAPSHYVVEMRLEGQSDYTPLAKLDATRNYFTYEKVPIDQRSQFKVLAENSLGSCGTELKEFVSLRELFKQPKYQSTYLFFHEFYGSLLTFNCYILNAETPFIPTLRASQYRPESLFLEWTLPENEQAFDFSKYIVEVKKKNIGDWEKVTEVECSKGCVDLEDLDSEEEYFLRLVPDEDYTSNFSKRTLDLKSPVRLEKATGFYFFLFLKKL